MVQILKPESGHAQHPEQQVEAEADSIMLHRHAALFIELLRCSAAAGKEVVWGV